MSLKHNPQLLHRNTHYYIPISTEADEKDYQLYMDIIEDYLLDRGYYKTDSPEKADYILLVDYGSDNGTEVIDNSTSVFNAIFKLLSKNDEVPKEYLRHFHIDIVNKDNLTVFRGRAENTGNTDDFSEIGRCLLVAIFHEFPGENRPMRTVVVPATCQKH